MPKQTEWLRGMIPAKNGYFGLQPGFKITCCGPKCQKGSTQLFFPDKASGKSLLRINGNRICK